MFKYNLIKIFENKTIEVGRKNNLNFLGSKK